MYLAVDDTDSRQGMCTTYLLTEIIIRSGLDLIGYPSLVRLNPAIEHKTRGNGALCANLGLGIGNPKKIGNFSGKALMAYSRGESGSHVNDLLDLANEVVGEMAELDEIETNPGIVVSEKKFDPSFYWKAVREEISLPQAEEFISQQGGAFRKIKNGRGIIGSAAAISWPGKDVTYEFISYRYPSVEPVDLETKISAAITADQIHGSFNNIDRMNRYAAIFPKERTPVVFGVRGTVPEALLIAAPNIIEKNRIRTDRSILYRTNQATDDHIISDPELLLPGRSYSIEGNIIWGAYSIIGGHYFAYLEHHNNGVKIAAFEPTKEFRAVFSQLAPGDRVRVFGTYRGDCLNVEKMEIKAVSSLFQRIPPLCSECGEKMHSKGHNDYRCNKCGSRSTIPFYRHEKRSIEPGLYDVPVIARRHLSRPFEMGYAMSDITETEVPA